jgi:hypothetical protein
VRVIHTTFAAGGIIGELFVEGKLVFLVLVKQFFNYS